jgi:hypothetical protein
MERQMHQRVFSLHDDVSERSGNVTAVPKGGSIANAALEALTKLTFSVDSQGKLSLPSLFLNPASMDQMSKEIAADPAAYEDAAKKILEEKKGEALAREQQRLSRYDGAVSAQHTDIDRL